MSLQSFGFFGFLLVVAAVYLHLPQRWQSAFLLAPCSPTCADAAWPRGKAPAKRRSCALAL